MDGASTNPPSPALSVASRSSAGESTKKVDRDAVAYVEYDLRWFTRSGFEVDLCGHATLAAAHALYELGPGAVPDGAVVRFHTRGGLIPVARVEDKKKPSREAADAPTEENGADDGNARKANAGGPCWSSCCRARRRAWRRSGGGTSRPPPTIRTTTTLRTTLRVVVRTERLRGAKARRKTRRRETATRTASRMASEGSRRRSLPSRRLPAKSAFFSTATTSRRRSACARATWRPSSGGTPWGDVFVCLTDHAALRRCVPDAPLVRFLTKGGRGLVACAAGGAVSGGDGRGPVDFSCRFFGPNIGIDEDPVTGSAFCGLAPYWQQRLGRKNGEEMVAHQASERGGVVRVAVVKKRGESPGAADETKVHARGRAVSVLKGEILTDGFEAEEA